MAKRDPSRHSVTPSPNGKNANLEREKMDANLLLQAWVRDGVSLDEQKTKVQSALRSARPLISILAERVGALDEHDKPEALKDVVGLLKGMEENERNFWIGTTSKTRS